MADFHRTVPASGGSTGVRRAEEAICPFDAALVEEWDAAQFGGGWRGRREERSIRRALARVPQGSHVLALPCGTGPLLEILVSCRYRVTCADCSEHRIRTARRRGDAIREREAPSEIPQPEFVVRDVLQTGYPDGHFDAIVCNRLFQHFAESEVRIRALSELRRISRGPVIVSFFNAFALGAAGFHLKHALRRTVPSDRIPIPAWVFLNDIRRAGLTPAALHPVMWGISPQWLVVGVPTAGRAAGTFSRGNCRRAEAG